MNKKHVKIAIDVQNGFVFDKVLGTEEARTALPKLVEFIKNSDKDDIICFTKDTHYDNYMETLEGKHLPVPHCIRCTEGWRLCPTFQTVIDKMNYDNDRAYCFEKSTFGSVDMMNFLKKEEKFFGEGNRFEDITFVGFCTDICVVSNALLARAYFPNTPIYVKADCCAGVTPERHKAALTIMEANHIDII